MTKKLDNDYVKKVIEDAGCELLDEYKNSHEPMKIRFLCGHIGKRTFNNFTTCEKICKKCIDKKSAIRKRTSTKEINSYIESCGCKWIGGVYENNLSELEFLFTCGHEGIKRYTDFERFEKICPNCYKNRKFTYDEVFNEFKNNGHLLIDKDYINANEKMSYSDSNGYKYFSSITNYRACIKKGSELRRFGNANPYSIHNIGIYLNINLNNFHLKDGQKWNGIKGKLDFYDDENYLYHMDMSTLVVVLECGSIPLKFDVANPYTLQNIQNWIAINNRPFHLIEGQKYFGCYSKLKFKCHKCHPDEIPFEAPWAAISQGGGCGICKGLQVGNCNTLSYLHPEIAKEWNYSLNYPITPNKITSQTNEKYYWICPDCGESYSNSPSSRVCLKRGCPKCNQSKGEKKIEQFLISIGLSPIRQYRFNDCRRGKELRFDFGVTNNGELILCEYQGIQHYEPIDFAGKGIDWAKNSFEDTKKKDRIKRDYCSKNNIRLIEIPYWDFKNIESILTKELNLDIEIQEKGGYKIPWQELENQQLQPALMT